MESITDITERIKNMFASNTKVLSFNTIRKRLNDGKTQNDNDYISSKQVSYTLRNTEAFAPVDPITIGCSKWYDARLFNKKNVKSSDRVRSRINLWRMC
jgi:hypothetical protein